MTEKKRTREDLKRARQAQNKKTVKPTKTWLKRIVLTIVALGALLFLGLAGLFAYYVAKAPELDEELLNDPISSEFYDVNGEIFATIGAENRKYINYEDIPQQMIDAIIATEDSRFFSHFGVDIWRLGGAVIANFRDGYGAQGASTITQQVVKNSFFTNEKKLERKAQEAWLAVQLERKYSKEEIFEMYFNKVLMSGRVYGFGTGAEYFFGKELKDLNLEEMALLAGMPQSPNNFNPFKHPESAEKRRNIVLSLMVQHNKITDSEATAAKATNITAGLLSEDHRVANSTTSYPAFLDVVLSEMEAKGDGEYLAEGVKVYTTLDPKAQTAVESAMNNDANFSTEDIQAGVAVIDTQTGEIRAIGGGRNYSGDFLYNHAYDLKTRSPGSTIKPLVDYGPAFEYLKWSTGQTTVDAEMTYSNSKQVITNWDSKYGGTMTVRQALYTSRNIPAVKAFQEVGVDRAQEFLSNIGIKTDTLYESDAIGGGNVNITPIQMAASYAAFGNNGMYNEPHSILNVIFRDGKSSKTYKSKPTVAMSDSTAYMVTDILRDTVSNKPGASAQAAKVPGVDIAGKTGTTNYSSDEFTKYNLKSGSVPDTWFTGYTTNYSIAIWGGYTHRKDAITSWDERRMPQRLFKTILSDLNVHNPSSTFTQPSSVVSATIEVGSNPLKLASANTPAGLSSTELFVKGTVPTEVSDEYVAVEIDPPFGVKASYNDLTKVVDLTWSHSSMNVAEGAETETPTNYTYEVTMTKEGEAPTVVSLSGAYAVQIPNIEPGKNYKFTVVAISGQDRSAGASVSIYSDGPIAEPLPTEPENPSDTIEPPIIEQPDDVDDNTVVPEEPKPTEQNGPGTIVPPVVVPEPDKPDDDTES